MLVEHDGRKVRLCGLQEAIVAGFIAEQQRMAGLETGTLTVNWNAAKGSVAFEFAHRSRATFPVKPEIPE